MLTFTEARQYLELFCAKLPKRDESGLTSPAFIIEGEPGVELRAKVYLPTILAPHLQIAQSRSSWRTERRAKQDAAFQAYRALYEAGLITDHLLPPDVPKESKAPKEGDEIEKRDSLYDVAKQYDPWPKVMQLWQTPSVTIYAHPLRLEDADPSYPNMLILLPLRLSEVTFDLFVSEARRLRITVGAGLEAQGYSLGIAQEITFLFLNSILGRRLNGLRKEQLPFLLVPEIDQTSPRDWYEAAAMTTPFGESRPMDGQTYLLRRNNEKVPYLWQPAAHECGGHAEAQTSGPSPPETVSALRISRKLDYLRPNAERALGWTQIDAIHTNELSVLGIPGEFCRLITMVPSIMYMLEVTLRAAAACDGPLSPIELDSLDLVSQALTVPSVCTRNYERLEFLGDVHLKLHAALQVFAEYPGPSFQLARHRDHIVNNARLQRATRTLGLDQYLTRESFSGNQWTAGVGQLRASKEKQRVRKISSKTLADTVEALIGAASLCGGDGANSEGKILSTLRLFINDVSWSPVSENMALIHSRYQPPETPLDMLQPVESMIGYAFQNRGLLAEALTQSSIPGGGHSTYDRLEFLGDAILDYVVGPKLFQSHLQLTASEMTVRRSALVNHYTLAFFAQHTSCTRSTFQVHTNLQTKESTNEEKHETVYLPDYIRCIGHPQVPLYQQATLAAFLRVRSSVTESFTTGKTFPWTKLSHLGAPKSYSDIIESILAAVFIDSHGNLGACEDFLKRIGYMSLVCRFVNEKDIDARHPETILHQFIQSQTRTATYPSLEYVTQERQNDNASGKKWRCKLVLEDEVIAKVKHGKSSEEARWKAAEKALLNLQKKQYAQIIDNLRKRKSREGQEDDPEECTEKKEAAEVPVPNLIPNTKEDVRDVTAEGGEQPWWKEDEDEGL